MNLQEDINRIKQVMGLNEGYHDVNILPAIVDQIYGVLEQNDIYLESAGGRDEDHYMIRCKDPYYFELYIKLASSYDPPRPYIHINFDDGTETNRYEFVEKEIPDFIDYVLSMKDIFLPFDKAVADHDQESRINARDKHVSRMGG